MDFRQFYKLFALAPIIWRLIGEHFRKRSASDFNILVGAQQLWPSGRLVETDSS
jgi:hypothetical protein